MLTAGHSLGSNPLLPLLRLLPSAFTAGALLFAALNVYFMTESNPRETRRNFSTVPLRLQLTETNAPSEREHVFLLYMVETVQQAESILRLHGDPHVSAFSEPQSAAWSGHASALRFSAWGTVILIPSSETDNVAERLISLASAELWQAGAELRVIDLRRK